MTSSTMPANCSTSIREWRSPSSLTVRRAESIIRRAAAARPRKASNTAWHRVDVASTAGESVVIRSSRTTSRHRPPARGTGLGPHSAASGAFASTAFTRRCSRARRAAERASSRAISQSPILPSRARHPARTVCALASPAASPSWASLSAAAPTAASTSSSRSGWISIESSPSKHVAHAASWAESTVAPCNWDTALAAELDVTRGQQGLAARDQ